MKRILYMAILLWLPAGCSLRTPSYPNDDYGPDHPVDVSQVPDAVPRKAPRSRYGNPDSYTVRGRTYHVMPAAWATTGPQYAASAPTSRAPTARARAWCLSSRWPTTRQ